MKLQLEIGISLNWGSAIFELHLHGLIPPLLTCIGLTAECWDMEVHEEAREVCFGESALGTQTRNGEVRQSSASEPSTGPVCLFHKGVFFISIFFKKKITEIYFWF